MAVETLSVQQARDLRELLLQRRRLLKAALERELHVDDSEAVRGTASTDADWSTADVEADIALTRLERDQSELNAIERALDRIERGDYAHCDACGAEIGYPRLLAHPTATHCLACQEKLEASGRAAR
jgi:DnaK suppressor protein